MAKHDERHRPGDGACLVYHLHVAGVPKPLVYFTDREPLDPVDLVPIADALLADALLAEAGGGPVLDHLRSVVAPGP
ncbi:MAG: hypothetical protein ACKOE2_08420, partial [Actinomycetales bacterium]